MNLNLGKSTFELLVPIVNSISGALTITAVTNNGGGSYTLSMCNTLWATTGYTITIGGNQYTITSIVPNVSLTVSGSVVPSVGAFNLYPPVFYHGTIQSTIQDLNEKVNNASNSTDKLPMIWLHESVDETINFQPTEPIYRNSNVDIYFLIDANFRDWTNDDHYTFAIKPMRQLIEAFLYSMKYSGQVNDNLIDTLKLNDLPRFGNYTAQDGSKKTIFSNYPLSGTRLSLTIPFLRNNKNCC